MRRSRGTIEWENLPSWSYIVFLHVVSAINYYYLFNLLSSAAQVGEGGLASVACMMQAAEKLKNSY